jgi:hypothetical protein
MVLLCLRSSRQLPGGWATTHFRSDSHEPKGGSRERMKYTLILLIAADRAFSLTVSCLKIVTLMTVLSSENV